MLGGGIPAGYSIMVAGPSGSGKTTLGTQFIIEAADQGETAMMAIFERRPADYLRTTHQSVELDRLIRAGQVELVYIRPLDLSVDETVEELEEAVKRTGAKRVVIDSLSGFELALSPAFREDFRESLYRMVGTLTALGVTIMVTAEVTDSFTELRLSPEGTSFVTDGIVLQRYVEIEGSVRRVMTVIKMRARAHGKELREYEITDKGIVVGRRLTAYRGILTGVASSITSTPQRASPSAKRPAQKRRTR
jgi:circadian clock protein KaiC